MKSPKRCENCRHLHTRFENDLPAHMECTKRSAVGEVTSSGGHCVCHWIDKGGKPRGCPGWER